MKLAISMLSAAVAVVAVSCAGIKVNTAPAIRGRATFTVKKLEQAKPEDPVLYDLSFDLPSDEDDFKETCKVYLRKGAGVYHAENAGEVEETSFPPVLNQSPEWMKLGLDKGKWHWEMKAVDLTKKEVLWVHVRVDFPNGESSYAYRVYPLVQPMEFVDVYLPD